MNWGYFILAPLLLVLWIYVVIIVKSCLISNTSIEVNIIGQKNTVSDDFFGKNWSVKEKVKYHIPKFMLELYEKNKGSRKNYSDADLVRSLIPSQAERLGEKDVLEEFSEHHLLIFNIPNSAKEERFIGAELKILTRIEIRSEVEKGVKKTLKISVFDEFTKTYAYLREFQIHHFNDTWLTFNLTREVEEILKIDSIEKTLKVMITVSAFYRHSQNHLKLSLLPPLFDHDHDYPILLLSYSITDQHKGHKRQRRSIEDDYEEETNHIWSGDIPKKALKKLKKNNCKRKPLYIDFSEIQYDLWIVQPTGYEAYQCQGRCFYPVAEHLSPTKHAIMQALVHSVNPSKASRSCCVPTLLDSISILYVDDKGVLTYRYAYTDMVVLECGCR